MPRDSRRSLPSVRRGQGSSQINGIQSQLSKQTAILILIATKDGIPAQEIANLTN